MWRLVRWLLTGDGHKHSWAYCYTHEDLSYKPPHNVEGYTIVRKCVVCGGRSHLTVKC